MANPQTNPALGQLRKLLDAQRNSLRSDDQLLARFLSERDEAAFAALVKRHGPMVLDVCQSVLRHTQDAEDACQTTFLVLAKKAGSIRKKTSVASWLHGVAYRLARKLELSRKPAPEPVSGERMAANPLDELTWREVRQIVHEELDRLPEKYRQPLILCYLEGQKLEQAARQLGLTAGTFKGMLTRGRDKLRQRLRQRGLAMAAPLFAGMLAPAAANAMFAKTTAQAAVLLVSGKALGDGISVQAAALLKWGMSAMAMTTLKVGVALLLAAVMLAAGVDLATHGIPVTQPAAAKQQAAPNGQQLLDVKQPAKPKEQPRVDFHGDPLPAGAVARIGNAKFLQAGGPYKFPIAYTPDGKQLISIAGGNAVLFWDAATGKELRRIAVVGHFIYTFVLSPDGKTLATVGQTYPNIRIWDVATCKEIHQITIEVLKTAKDAEEPPTAAFTPDGRSFAAYRGDGIIRLWDTATWQAKQSLQPFSKGATTPQLTDPEAPSYHFLPDGKTLISTWDGKNYNGITWWDIATKKQIRRLEVEQAGPFGAMIKVSPNGKCLAGLLKGRVLCFWNTATGEEIGRTDLEFKGKGRGCCFCFSPDSQILACNVIDTKETIFFAANIGKEIRRWKDGAAVSNMGAVSNMAFSPDGKTLAQSVRGGMVIELRDSVTGRPTIDLKRLPTEVIYIGFNDNGKSLLTGFRDGGGAGWESRTGKQVEAIQLPPGGPMGPSNWLYTACFTAPGKKAAWVDAQGVVHVWDPTTGNTVSRIEAAAVQFRGPVLSHDGTMLAAYAKDFAVAIWDTASGKLRHALPSTNIGCCTFSLDGRLVATAANEKAIRVWDTTSGKMATQLIWKDAAPVRHLAFSPDGKSLLSNHWGAGEDPGGFDRDSTTMRFWDLATAKETKRFSTPPGSDLWGNSSMVISLDLKTAAIATFGGIVLCELATGQERGRFSGHCAHVYALDFSSDGRLLASGSGDHTALVWDVTGVCPDGKMVPRDLPPAEIKRLWTDLADASGVKAYRAMWTLVAAGKQVLPFLGERLRPVPAPDDARIARLIADLDSEQFKVRSQATKELQQLGELAERALRTAWEGKITLETRQRLTLLLDEIRNRLLSSEQLQMLRALEVLENAATPEARKLLQTLSLGAQAALQTKEAKASLERLAKRS